MKGEARNLQFLSGVTRTCVWILLIGSLAFLSIGKLAPSLNADTILVSIMSLERVTLFYWGQDRYANLVPFVLSPISDPATNLQLQLLVFSSAYFALLYVLSRLLTALAFTAHGWWGELFVFSLLANLTVALFNEHWLHVFLVEAQPYSISYLFLALALFTCADRREELGYRWVFCGGLILFSVGLNPSVILAGLAFCFGVVLVHGRAEMMRRALVLSLLILIAFAVWSGLSAAKGVSQPISYSGFEFGGFSANLVKSAQQLLSGVRGPVFAGLAIVLLLIRFLWLRRLPDTSEAILRGLMLFGLGWWFIFSNNSWVLASISHFRYFFPVYVALLLGISIILLNSVRNVPRRSLQVASLLMLGATAASFGRFPPAVDEFDVFRRVQGYADFAEAESIRYIAGDYWVVWPTVHSVLRKGLPAFGITDRGDGNAEAVRRSFQTERTQGVPRAMCLSAAAEICLGQLQGLTHKNWRLLDSSCPGNCKLLSLARD